MFSNLRSLAILAALATLLPVARAQAQYETDDEGETFPQRMQNFGRSLVGTYRANNNRPSGQRPVRNAAPPRQADDPYYEAAFGDDDVAPRRGNAPASSGEQGMRRGRQPQAPQPAPARRPVDNSATAHAPPLQQPPARSAPHTAAPAAAAGGRDGVQRMARAVTPGQADRDLTPAAASAAAPDALVVRGISPSISVETIGPRKISVGKQATYKLVLKNTGAMAARDVVVTVAVPEFAEVIDAKGTSGATEPAPSQDGLCWKLGTLAPQGREELSLDIVPHKSQPFDLAVRWTQAPVASQTTVEVQEPKLSLTLDGAKEVSFGDRSIYKLLLSNPGNGDAENVMITLMPLNPGDGPPASHPLGVLRAGESKTIEIELVARQAGQVTIHAEAKAAGDIRATLEEQVLVRRASLAVTAQGPKIQYANTEAAYEIRVKNSGNAAAQNLRVTCRLPRGAEYISCSSSGHYGAEDNAVQWTVTSLEPNAEMTLSTKCVLKSPGTNLLDVSCLADREVQQGASATTQVEAVADLAMEVVDPSGPVLVGTEMVYEIHVRNRGSKTAEAIDLIAYFSNGIEPVAVEGGPHEMKPGMVVIRTIPTIDMGREAVYKVKARADVPGTHRFRVELNCKTLDTKLTGEETTLFYSEPTESAQ